MRAKEGVKVCDKLRRRRAPSTCALYVVVGGTIGCGKGGESLSGFPGPALWVPRDRQPRVAMVLEAISCIFPSRSHEKRKVICFVFKPVPLGTVIVYTLDRLSQRPNKRRVGIRALRFQQLDERQVQVDRLHLLNHGLSKLSAARMH